MNSLFARNLFITCVVLIIAALSAVAAKSPIRMRGPSAVGKTTYLLTVRFHGIEAKRDILIQTIALTDAEPFRVITTVGDDTYTLAGKITEGTEKLLSITANWRQVEERFPDGQVRTRSRSITTQVRMKTNGEAVGIGGMKTPVPKEKAENLTIYVALNPDKGD